MRIHLVVLAAFCFAAVYTAAVPVRVVEVPSEKSVEQTTVNSVSTSAQTETRQARQQAAAEEDDDDDDDDDELDLDVVDDDDDDDDDDDSTGAAEDDDDDDDYFGGLFDDILGDDDDDDDDDDTPAAAQPVVSPAETFVPEESIAEEEYDAATDSAIGESLDSDLENKDPAAIGIDLPPNAVIVQPVPADEDDDDDDDDEDELDALTGDDDDDDDDDDDAAADDDDDDDDDDDELDALADAGDVIEARRSRGFELERDRTAVIYVSKYNRFIDNIIGRVNRILRRSYDPVRVKLNSSTSTKKTKSKRKNNPRPVNKSGETTKITKTSNKSSSERIRNSNKSGTRKNVQTRKSISPGNLETNSVKISETPRATNAGQPKKQPQRKRVKNNKKKGSTKSTQRARATLYGLSTIKREGDVSVNMMADHTTVKTNFAVGPLTLRVEKEFGRGQRREIKSATATTAEMRGKLSLRVTNSGNASLHSIKVLQPKQVRVESADEHDRTREFIWRRSSHIAHLVSQKLAAATRSMLKPSAKSFSNSSTTTPAVIITTPTPTKVSIH